MTSSISAYQEAGLYDPAAPNAPDRLALLEWFANRGVSVERMARALREGRLVSLAGDLITHEHLTLTLPEVAARAGMTPERIEAICLAAGLPRIDPRERTFSERDVPGFRSFEEGALLFGEEAIGRFTRVAGSSLARIAEAVVSLFLVNIEGPLLEAKSGELALAQANAIALERLDELPQALALIFRSQVENAIRRFRHARRGPGTDTLHATVGFVDLVGFTPLSRRLSARELADVVERFETAAHDVATARDGRVVKLIGDAVMFVAVEAAPACDIALTLMERFASDPSISPRGGLAAGELLVRGGDYYGPVVNLAARLADLAVPRELLVTTPVTDEAAGPGLRFEPAGKRLPKGFDEPVILSSVERA
ncbi:MAG: adenylate cyclase regulatory domain-containing protein [Candidatus Binatia bacterium]